MSTAFPAVARAGAGKGPAIALYRDPTFKEEQTVFSPFDKVYAVLAMSVGLPGRHVLVTDWQTPAGPVESQSTYRFSSYRPGEHLFFYSWLQLRQNSALARNFTGQDFKAAFFGRWTVRFYLDGQPVAARDFFIR